MAAYFDGMKKIATSSFSLFLLCCICALVLSTARVSLSASPKAALSPPPATFDAGTPFAAIGALERNRKTPPQALQRYLDSKDVAVEARAVIALARLGNPSGLQSVTKIFLDPQTPADVKASAAFALGVFGSSDSIDALNAAAGHDGGIVAPAAAEALGRIGGARAVEALVQLLSSADAAVRANAAVGVGEAGLPGTTLLDGPHRQSAAAALSSALAAESNREAKWRMAWALSRSFYQNDPRLLRRLLTDRDDLVRLYAVRGLGKLKDKSYALPVRLASTDSSWRVRVEAHLALLALKDTTRVDLKPPLVPKTDLVAPEPLPSTAPYSAHPEVAFDTTKGFIVLELFPDQAPYSVDNFLHLVDRGFYNGSQFFRVIQDFVVQGGDPKNTGDGGPGYSIPAELNPLQQLSGIISYGLDYDPKKNVPLIDTAGSQYYITESPQLHLDRGFTVFGRVVRGMAVVYAIVPHEVPRQAGDAAVADVARRVYRCKPTIEQTAEVEDKLRHAEVDYDAR